MSTELLIEEILKKHPEISGKELQERLERERKKVGGLISDETLLRMIAAEFGLKIPQNNALAPKLSLDNLIPGLSNVTAVGRVVAVFPPKTFNGANRSGRIASLFIADESGVLRVVLWNDKVNFIESGLIKVGQVIRVSHGYTKEDRFGKSELHVGEKSEIEINPCDVEAKEYPTISRFSMKIGDINHVHRNRKINVKGMVKKVFPASAFERQDMSSGKIMRFVLADETGEISVVVWNDKVDELENMLAEGAELQIVNARLRKALGEGLEIHVDAGTYIETAAEEFLKIADLKEGLSSVDVEGEVATKPAVREVKTAKGELVMLAVFELKDDTGKIMASAWREHAKAVSNMNVGDRVCIRKAYVKRGFGEQIEIVTRGATSITLLKNAK